MKPVRNAPDTAPRVFSPYSADTAPGNCDLRAVKNFVRSGKEAPMQSVAGARMTAAATALRAVSAGPPPVAAYIAGYEDSSSFMRRGGAKAYSPITASAIP